MRSLFFKYSVMVLPLLALLSCGKGYQIRCTNFYTADMDTVKIGKDIIFTNIKKYATSEFVKIKRGQYPITFISNKKEFFYSNIFIPGSGGGKRTVQIDAAEQISILEE
jgi:hypothetical protein